jgi:ElaB/YqjD/DUF883 family membrane-anchored ribosome-binding protein
MGAFARFGSGLIRNHHQDKIMRPLSNSDDANVSANGMAGRNKSSLLDGASKNSSGASREFHNFVADIEDLITRTTSLTGEDLDKTKAQLNERIAAARAYLDEVSSSVVQRARQTAMVANTYVHDQPWAAIGIGAAVGTLFGFMLGRRKQ